MRSLDEGDGNVAESRFWENGNLQTDKQEKYHLS